MSVAISNETTLHDRRPNGRKLPAGFARIQVRHLVNNYTTLDLRRVRAALDHITLEDPSATVNVRLTSGYARNFTPGNTRWQRNRATRFAFALAPNGKIRVTMPCGEVRDYKLRTLDRVLLAFGV